MLRSRSDLLSRGGSVHPWSGKHRVERERELRCIGVGDVDYSVLQPEYAFRAAHACVVEDFCLIGMGSIILDGARIGHGSLVGAGALVTPGTEIPPNSLVIGSPAKVKRPVNDKEREQIAYGASQYVELTRVYLASGDGSSVAE